MRSGDPFRVQHLTHGSCHERRESIRPPWRDGRSSPTICRCSATLAEQPDLRLRDVAQGRDQRASRAPDRLRARRGGISDAHPRRIEKPLRGPPRGRASPSASTPSDQRRTASFGCSPDDGDSARAARTLSAATVERTARRAPTCSGSCSDPRRWGCSSATSAARLVAVNPAFCAILEPPRGRAPRSRLPGDHASRRHRRRRARRWGELASGDRTEYVREKRYVRPGRVPGVGQAARRGGRSIRDTGARLFVAHVVDISERRRREQALAEAEDRFRSAFDNAPIGMALVAPDGRFIKVNRALCDLTGHSETDAAGPLVPGDHPRRTISTPISPTSRTCSPTGAAPTRWRSATTTPTATSSG